jgi:acyl carrier protein
MFERVKEIICDYVEINEQEITPDSSLRYDIKATSFDLMNIAVAIEEEFGLTVPDSALPRIKTVNDIVNLLENN